MSQHPIISPRDEIINTMIDLAHLSRSQRIVVAGSDSAELYLALRRRGFAYPVLASGGRIPRAQYSAGLIAGEHSFQAIETVFLGAAANVAILIESQESGLGVKVRNRLQQLGFRVEAGARCRDGFVLAAHRQDFDQGFGQSLGAIANVA